MGKYKLTQQYRMQREAEWQRRRGHVHLHGYQLRVPLTTLMLYLILVSGSIARRMLLSLHLPHAALLNLPDPNWDPCDKNEQCFCPSGAYSHISSFKTGTSQHNLQHVYSEVSLQLQSCTHLTGNKLYWTQWYLFLNRHGLQKRLQSYAHLPESKGCGVSAFVKTTTTTLAYFFTYLVSALISATFIAQNEIK